MEQKNVVVFANAKTGFRHALAQSLVLASASVVGAANAAIDVSSLTGVIADGVVAAAAIGLAFLAFKGGIAVFKSLRSAA